MPTEVNSTPNSDEENVSDSTPRLEVYEQTPEPAAQAGERVDEDEKGAPAPRRWSVPVPRRSTGALVTLLAVSVVTNGLLGWQVFNDRQSARESQSSLIALKSTADDQQHAEQVALDYAKGAAEMDYKDIPGWTKRITANTSPELAAKLKQASSSMEQIIVPLQWTSQPTPIIARIRSEENGVYVVLCFVSIMTKNVQAKDGIQSTATYTVTVNKNQNWVIADVGGVGSALKSGK